MKSTLKKKKEQRSSKQLEEVQRITEIKKCWNFGKSSSGALSEAQGNRAIRLLSNGQPRYQDKTCAKRCSQVININLSNWKFYLLIFNL